MPCAQLHAPYRLLLVVVWSPTLVKIRVSAQLQQALLQPVLVEAEQA